MLVNSSTETKDHQSLLEFIEGELERWREAIEDENSWLDLKTTYLAPEISNILERNNVDVSKIDERFDQEFKELSKSLGVKFKS